MATKQQNGLVNGPSSESGSDLAQLWEKAIDEYEKKTKKSLKRSPVRSMEEVIKSTEEETKGFKAYRHDGGKADKIRTAFKNNMGLIQKVVGAVQILGNAAAAFPPAMPAALIFNAFSQVTASFNNVSADYDRVLGFFEFTQRFFDRLSMIEQEKNRPPKPAPFQRCVVRVFSSMLTICAVAQDMKKEARFKKWVITLMEGSDPALVGAYTTMESAINELSQAVGLATLRSVEIIAETIQKMDEKLDFTVTKMTTLDEGMQVVASNTSVVIKQNQVQDQKTDLLLEGMRTLTKLSRETHDRALEKEKEAKSRSAQKKGKTDPGENKRMALEQVKGYFTELSPKWDAITKGTKAQRNEIHCASVKGTGAWLLQEESYKAWINQEKPLLWMRGSAGIGKSFLAETVIKELESSPKERNPFAYFFFREEEDNLRHFKQALYSLSFQLAEMDAKYADQLANELSDSTGEPEPWKRLFAERFDSKSDGHAYLVLDGIDEMEETDLKEMLQCLDQIAKSDSNIHVLLSGRPDISSRPDMSSELEPLQASILEVTKEKLTIDIQKVIVSSLGQFPRLKKFRKQVKYVIARKIKSKADGMRYVDHMLRRLSYIGREKSVLKDLEKNLPDNLDELYSLMLSECQANRTEEQYRTLKKLFAWLAYSKRALSLGEAAELINLTVHDTKTFDIEDELIGRSSRILELARTPDYDDDDEGDEKADASDQSTDGAEIDLQDSGNVPLNFQERSLREYFQAVDVDEKGLRTPPSAAHLTIFEIATDLLFKAHEKADDDDKQPMILNYAVDYWAKHLVEIDLSKATDNEVARVVGILYKIMNNHNNVAAIFETFGNTLYSELLPEDGAPWLKTIKDWTVNATSSDTVTLTPDVEGWAKDFVTSEAPLMTLARGHVLNSYTQHHGLRIYDAFKIARDALKLSNVDLTTDSVETVLKVADQFPDIERNAGAMRAISCMLSEFGFNEEALTYSTKGLEMLEVESGHNPALRFRLMRSIALSYASLERHEESIAEIDKAITLLPPDWKVNKELNDIVQWVYEEKAASLRALGKADEAIENYNNIRAVTPTNTLDWWLLDDMTRTLFFSGRDPDGTKLLALLRDWNEKERISWFDEIIKGNDTYTMEKLNQMASHNAEDGLAFLLQCYNNYMATLSPRGDGIVFTHAALATTYRIVVGDESKAKDMYKEILKHTLKNLDLSPLFDEILFGVRRCLAEIIFGEFHQSHDPAKKVALLEELKSFASQRTSSNDYFKLEGSNISIMVALMSRIVGQTTEFQTTLQKTFDNCIDGLTDTVGWNDSTSFRLLAKVLACMEGLERDALIAISCQFSKVTEENDPEDENSAKEATERAANAEQMAKEKANEEDEKVANTEETSTEKAEEEGNIDQVGADASEKTADHEATVDSNDKPAEDHVKEPIHLTETTIMTATIADGIEKDKSTVVIEKATVEAYHESDAAKTTEDTANGITDETTKDTTTQEKGESTEKEPPVDEYADEEKVPENPDEEFGYGGLSCDGECARAWSKYEVPIYFCLICANTDLCPTCYGKRIAMNKGEKNSFWRSYCGMNHRYAKGPIKGWKGVKGGAWRIEGEDGVVEEKLVQDWLKELKEVKWPKAWESFWCRLEGVRDLGF